MSVDYVLQTTFSLVTDPDDPKFQKCVDNPEWWEERFTIMRGHFLPSIENQTFQDFYRIANFESVSDLYHSKSKCVHLLQDHGFYLDMNYNEYPVNWPTDFELISEITDADWIVVYEADSDDLLAPEALQCIKDKEDQIEEGRVFSFKKGYISDFDGEKIGVYEHNSSQFYAKVFPREALLDRDSFVDYSEKHRFDSGHPDLRRGGKMVYLPDFKFLHSAHDSQHSSGWDDQHTVKHVTEWIEDEERKNRVRDTFNLN